MKDTQKQLWEFLNAWTEISKRSTTLKYAFAQETAIRQRLYQIDTALMDYFISWDRTKRLLQEQAKLHEKLRELGFEP